MAPADGATTAGKRSPAPMSLARAQRLSGIALDNADLSPLIDLVRTAPWIRTVGRPERLDAGELTRTPLVIPQAEAQTALRGVVRLVADLPRDTTPVVVWQDRGSELEVDTAATTIACKVGVVTIGIAVRCDELPERTTVEVPFGVGTEQRPTGLVMSSLTRLSGPAVVVDRWSDAITGFAWECLVETSRRLCELLGTDAAGRHLLPGSVGSGSRVLIVQPMAAHTMKVAR